MNDKRALRLRREVLTELRDGELESVAGAMDDTLTRVVTACVNTLCITCITCVFVCAADADAVAGR